MSAHGARRRLLGALIAMLLIACAAAGPAMAAAPTVTIATPTAGATFAAGQTVAFSGSATEANGDAVPAARLSWSLDSGSTHVRDLAGVQSGSFTWSTSPDPSSYSLTLTATGADGASASDTVELDPKTVELTFASEPTGQVIGFNLLQRRAPWTRTVAAGAAIYINAPSWGSSGGEDYVFSSWSDDGGRIHRITAPTVDTTYTATYARPATTTLAGDTTIQSQVDSNPKGTAEAFRTTATSGGTVSAVDLYVDSSSNATSMAVALYADTAGHPGARLATGTLSSPRAGQWNAVPVSAASVTAGSTYWIAVLGTGTGTLKFRDKPGGGRAETSSQTTLTSLPATWSTGTTHSDGPLSATATASNIPKGAFLDVAPTGLQFDATSGGAAPPGKTLRVSNRSGSALAFDVSENASWLTVTPTTGGTPRDLTVTVDPSGLAAGTYATNVRVHSFDGQQGPDPDGFRDIPVTFTAKSSTVAPKLDVTPASLSFTAYTGEGNPASKSLTSANDGGGALSYSTATDRPWLSASPASGSAPGTVTVAIDASGLATGTYTGHVTIDAGAVDGSPTVVPVTLTLDRRPSVTLTPDTLTFTAKEGDPSPAAKTVRVDNDGGGTLQYQVDMHSSWITVTPASGTAPQDLTVAVDTTGMTAGSHHGFVIFDTNGGGPTLTVNVEVEPADPKPPSLTVSPASLSFHGVSGGAAPAAQTLTVANAGDGSLSFATSDDAGWLSASPASGTAPASVSVAVDLTGLAAGTYNGTLTIDGGTAGARAIAVTLTVDPPTTMPAGLVGYWSFDETTGTTAADGSGLGNTGTLNGPVHTAGKLGNGLRFDGVNDWVTVADAASLDLTTQMTLEAWVYPTSGGSSWRTAVLKERTGDLAYALYTSSGNGRPSGHVSTTSDMAANGTATLPLSKWTHLATTYDGATLRLFVNGAQVAAKAVTGAAVTSTGALRFGGNAVWGEWFAGTLDEIRIYKRALTATEIQADMNRGAAT